jgi:hypothetical protein
MGEKKKRDTELLFAEGNWEIHNNPLQHFRLNPAVSRVVHWCSGTYYGKRIPAPKDYCHVWSSRSTNLTCPQCQELMPDSIQTLWTLQNFDVDFSQEYGFTDQPHEVS